MITKTNCHEKLGQLWVAPPTPFKDDYSLDLDGLRNNLRFLVENRIPVIAYPVGVGEVSKLTLDEYRQVVEVAVDEIQGRAILVATADPRGIPECFQMAQIAEKAGADVLLVPVPQFPEVNDVDAEAYSYYRRMADTTGLPLQVYQGTALPLTMQLMERLVEIPSVVAYKEVPYNPTYFYNLSRRFGDRIALIMGRRGEGELRQIFYREAGAHGYWSVLALISPELAWEHWNAWIARDYGAINKICDRTAPIFDLYSDMYDEYYKTSSINNLVAYKELMNAVGLAGGITRAPSPLATAEDKTRVKEALVNVGIPITDTN